MAKKAKKADPSLTPAVQEFLERAGAGMEISELDVELEKLYDGRSKAEMVPWLFARDSVKKNRRRDRASLSGAKGCANQTRKGQISSR